MVVAVCLLSGALLMLACGGVSLWLAKGLWRSRTMSLESEILILKTQMTDQTTIRSLHDQMRLLSDVVDKLDTNVFKLIQIQTQEIGLARPGGMSTQAGWSTDKPGLPHRYDEPPGLPDALGLPT